MKAVDQKSIKRIYRYFFFIQLRYRKEYLFMKLLNDMFYDKNKHTFGCQTKQDPAFLKSGPRSSLKWVKSIQCQIPMQIKNNRLAIYLCSAFAPFFLFSISIFSLKAVLNLKIITGLWGFKLYVLD